MRAVSGLRESLIATLVMAVTSTAADAFWAAAISEHRMLYGLTHGALLLAVMGAVIACATGCRRTGFAALAGLLIGVLAAAAFYLLSPLVRFRRRHGNRLDGAVDRLRVREQRRRP